MVKCIYCLKRSSAYEAVIYNCDITISWNFKHLVNFKTINKVKVVNAIHLYKEISIISPTMLIEEADE